MIDENLIAGLTKRRVVTDTFRRLDQDKKRLVYDTAIRLFGEYGYDGLPVDRFCAEAGISKGSFFHYFPSKTHLLEFTLLMFDAGLETWVGEVVRQEKAVMVKDRIRYAYNSFVASARLNDDERKFYQFATHAIIHAGVAVAGVDMARHIRGHLNQIVARAVETGEIRGDLSVEVQSYLLNAFMQGLLDRAYLGKAPGTAETVDGFITFLFDGMKG
ncbi:MAG: TetR/AcrR family transcriptional regulator [candidate division Zixibacteria bacterium]|nr:TetR/AcrR family transcriptional regulator [candidate division Zixibacteria bacterium]